MQQKLKNKWGINPSEPIYHIGNHSIVRYKNRIANGTAAVVKQRIYASVLGGTVILERAGTRYIQSQDKTIYPCICKGSNNYAVKTTLPQEMQVLFGRT